jgi:hypothetical protein
MVVLESRRKYQTTALYVFGGDDATSFGLG